MSRAGREPAEDVKRRIVAACQEGGLKVLSANMYLRPEANNRVILVQAVHPDRPYRQCGVEIITLVTVGGAWSGKLDLRCAAWDQNSEPNVWDIPVMRGRGSVPLEGLVDALAKTFEEQQQVIAAMRMEVDGPYTFDQTSWETPPAILGQ